MLAKGLTTDLINGYIFLLGKHYFDNGASQSCLVSKLLYISVTTVIFIRVLNLLMVHPLKKLNHLILVSKLFYPNCGRLYLEFYYDLAVIQQTYNHSENMSG